MKLCPRLSRIESLKVRYSVDQSGLGTAVVEVAAEFHVHSNTLEMLSHFRSKRVLCLPFYSHFQTGSTKPFREKPGAEQVSLNRFQNVLKPV